MKTKISPVIAVLLLSIFASNAFAVLRPTYPVKPYPADHIIMIGERRAIWFRAQIEDRNEHAWHSPSNRSWRQLHRPESRCCALDSLLP